MLWVHEMHDEVTAEDLLTAWQDAMLAVDLAERLAKSALEAAESVDRMADEAEAIAALAEQAVVSAEAVAVTARAAADRARHAAGQMRADGVTDVKVALGHALANEEAARERWRTTRRTNGPTAGGPALGSPAAGPLARRQEAEPNTAG